MIPTVLPGLLSIVAATLSDQGEVISSKGEAIGGFTDEDLFLLLWGNANVFGEMTFKEAVEQDPRRVEARIQQSLQQVLKKTLSYRMDDVTWRGISQRAYIERNAKIRRKDGSIDVEAMADETMKTAMVLAEVYGDVKATAGDPVSSVIIGVIDQQRPEIEKALREGIETALRAADEDPSHADAWRKIAASVKGLGQIFYEGGISEIKGPFYGAEISMLHKLSLAIGGE